MLSWVCMLLNISLSLEASLTISFVLALKLMYKCLAYDFCRGL